MIKTFQEIRVAINLMSHVTFSKLEIRTSKTYLLSWIYMSQKLFILRV